MNDSLRNILFVDCWKENNVAWSKVIAQENILHQNEFPIASPRLRSHPVSEDSIVKKERKKERRRRVKEGKNRITKKKKKSYIGRCKVQHRKN